VTDIKGTAALTRRRTDSDALCEAEADRLKDAHDQEFTRFMEESYQSVERILRSRWQDRQAVEDAVQDAFLHGRVKWSELRDHVERIGWIICTARYKLLKDHERRQREAVVAPEDLPPSPQSDIADAWEAQETLRGWLNQLPARHAEVFQMSQEGFCNQEIANILGLTENSVRSYKTAAKKRLRELAEDAGFNRSENGRHQGSDRGSR